MQLSRNLTTVDSATPAVSKAAEEEEEVPQDDKPGFNMQERTQTARGGTVKVQQAPFNPERPTLVSQVSLLEQL